MNTDFRVSVSLPTHPKTMKLMRRCGDIAFYNLVKFWAFVAQNRPDGSLHGLDADDVEIAGGWNGQCSMFFQALLDFRFIDQTDGKLVVHDWQDHNGYACHARARSLKAKLAAEARWKRKNDATSMGQALPNDATSNAPAPTPDPVPDPDPDLKDNSSVKNPKGNGSFLKKHEYPDWLNKNLWLDFVKMRVRIKKPITTERTISTLINKLENLIAEGHAQDDVIQNSIDNCWRSFFPPGEFKKSANRIQDANIQACQEFINDERIR